MGSNSTSQPNQSAYHGAKRCYLPVVILAELEITRPSRTTAFCGLNDMCVRPGFFTSGICSNQSSDIRLIVVDGVSTKVLRPSPKVERSDGLAQYPSAGQNWLGFRTRCEHVGLSRGVAEAPLLSIALNANTKATRPRPWRLPQAPPNCSSSCTG